MTGTDIYNWLIERAKLDGFIAVRGACRAFIKSGAREGVTPTKRQAIPRKWVEAALARQHGFCARKRHQITFAEATGDHRIPINEGGKHTKANIVAMCRSCNSGKGAKMPIAESKASGRTILEQMR